MLKLCRMVINQQKTCFTSFPSDMCTHFNSLVMFSILSISHLHSTVLPPASPNPIILIKKNTLRLCWKIGNIQSILIIKICLSSKYYSKVKIVISFVAFIFWKCFQGCVSWTKDCKLSNFVLLPEHS